MKILVALAVSLVAAGSASAQVQIAPPGVALGILANAATNSHVFASFTGDDETPTMRRQKLARAIALRDEAAVLQAEDGGTLSASNIRYLRRKARDILGY